MSELHGEDFMQIDVCNLKEEKDKNRFGPSKDQNRIFFFSSLMSSSDSLQVQREMVLASSFTLYFIPLSLLFILLVNVSWLV